MSVFSRAWEKDEILSPSRGIETETFGFRSIMLYHWATKNPQWARPFRKLYGTYFQRNTRSSNVKSVIRSMAFFERGYYSVNNTGMLGEKELKVLLVRIETSRFGRHGRLCRLTKSVVTNFLHTAWIGILMHNDDVTESGEFLSHA